MPRRTDPNGLPFQSDFQLVPSAWLFFVMDYPHGSCCRPGLELQLAGPAPLVSFHVALLRSSLLTFHRSLGSGFAFLPPGCHVGQALLQLLSLPKEARFRRLEKGNALLHASFADGGRHLGQSASWPCLKVDCTHLTVLLLNLQSSTIPCPSDCNGHNRAREDEAAR